MPGQTPVDSLSILHKVCRRKGRRQVERISRREIDLVAKVGKLSDGQASNRIRDACVQEAGHQFCRQHGLTPVRICRTGSPHIFDGHSGYVCPEPQIVFGNRQRTEEPRVGPVRSTDQPQVRPDNSEAKRVAHFVQGRVAELPGTFQCGDVERVEFDERCGRQVRDYSLSNDRGLAKDSVRTVNRCRSNFDHDVVDLSDTRHKHVRHIANDNLFPSSSSGVKRCLLTGAEVSGEPEINVERVLRSLSRNDRRCPDIVAAQAGNVVRQRDAPQEDALSRKHVVAVLQARAQVNLAVDHGRTEVLSGSHRSRCEAVRNQAGQRIDFNDPVTAGFGRDESIRIRRSGQTTNQNRHRWIHRVNVQRVDNRIRHRVEHVNVDRVDVHDVNQSADNGEAVVLTRANRDRIGIANGLSRRVNLVQRVGARSIQIEEVGSVKRQSVLLTTERFRSREAEQFGTTLRIEFDELIVSVDRECKQSRLRQVGVRIDADRVCFQPV